MAGSITICSYRPEQSGRGAPTRYDGSPPSRAADETARDLRDQLPDVVLVKSWRSLSLDASAADWQVIWQRSLRSTNSRD